MSKVTRIGLVSLILFSVAAFAFWDEINRFLFHPEGLSTAASDFCLTNQSGIDVVAKLSVLDGAVSTTLMANGETACSAATGEGKAALVQVSLADKTPPFCEYEGKSGTALSLTVFDAPDNCEWSQ